MKKDISRCKCDGRSLFSLVDAIGFGLREEIAKYAKKYNKSGTEGMKTKTCVCLLDLFFHPFFSSVFEKPEDVLQFANRFIQKREKITVDDLILYENYRISPVNDRDKLIEINTEKK